MTGFHAISALRAPCPPGRGPNLGLEGNKKESPASNSANSTSSHLFSQPCKWGQQDRK